jgi:hypothetical protein
MSELSTQPARTDHPVAVAIEHLSQLLQRDDEKGGLPPGDKADLRRMEPDDTLPPALWRLLVLPDIEQAVTALSTTAVDREVAERGFAILIRTMLEAGTLGSRPVGAALAKPVETDNPQRQPCYPEARMVRLLRARGRAEVAQEARQAARWCAVQGAPLRFTDRGKIPNGFGRFLLDATLKRDESAERRAHAIARDYFANLPRE